MKTVKTKAGTELPLMNLKGKDYLQVAHRIVWFTEENAKANIQTDFLKIDDEQTVCKATVVVFDAVTGAPMRMVQATKRETKKDFADHTEKAETGAVGRALALLGYGTQFAVELDEGNRIVDAPQLSARADAAPTPAPTGGGFRKIQSAGF